MATPFSTPSVSKQSSSCFFGTSRHDQSGKHRHVLVHQRPAQPHRHQRLSHGGSMRDSKIVVSQVNPVHESTNYCVGIENDVVYNLYRNYLGFCVTGHRNWLVFRVRIEIGLFLLRGSKLTLFLCAGRKLLGFNVWIENDLAFRVGIEIDFVFVCRSKWHVLVLRSIDLVLVWVVEIGLFLVCGQWITWF